MREHFPDIESTDVFSLATLTDPKFRTTASLCNQKADNATALLLEKVTDAIVNESQRNVQNSGVVVDEDDDWAASMQGSANDRIDPEISIKTIDQDIATTELNM